MLQAMGEDALLRSPYWCVAESAIVGLIIGYFVTHFGSAGAETV